MIHYTQLCTVNPVDKTCRSGAVCCRISIVSTFCILTTILPIHAGRSIDFSLCIGFAASKLQIPLYTSFIYNSVAKKGGTVAKIGGIIIKKTEALWFLTHASQCKLQIRDNTTQQVQMFKCLGVVLRVTEDRTERLVHGLVRQTQFFVSFIVPWPRKGSFQTPQSFHFKIVFLFLSW